MNSIAILFFVVIAIFLLGAIIVSVLLTITFAKSPTINLVQGKLKDGGDAPKDAMKYLKITNKEFHSLVEQTNEVE